MSERSEPKQVCRRNALAFLGYAAVFALVASPAILAVSQAEAQTTTAPATPTTPPTDAPSLGQSAVRNGEPGEQNAARNAAPDAQSDGSSGAQDVTSDETRATAPPPPSKKSNNLFAANNGNRPRRRPCRVPGARGIGYRASRRASGAGGDLAD